MAGQVPLVIEIKDQDGALGPDVGALEQSVARALDGYTGPVAVMSFNPHSVAAMRDAAPDVPRGLTTCAFRAEDWDGVPPDRLRALARLEAVDPTGAAFVSHDARDLAAPRIAELKRAGLPILCWTIRTPGAGGAGPDGRRRDHLRGIPPRPARRRSRSRDPGLTRPRPAPHIGPLSQPGARRPA